MSTTPASMHCRRCLSPAVFPVPAGLVFSALPLRGQLLTNLQSFPDRISVGDPQVVSNDHKEGPKGEATADFNGDGRPDLAAGNLDGTVTVLFGLGGGSFPRRGMCAQGRKEFRKYGTENHFPAPPGLSGSAHE